MHMPRRILIIFCNALVLVNLINCMIIFNKMSPFICEKLVLFLFTNYTPTPLPLANYSRWLARSGLSPYRTMACIAHKQNPDYSGFYC
jgi:hypothetical protein